MSGDSSDSYQTFQQFLRLAIQEIDQSQEKLSLHQENRCKFWDSSEDFEIARKIMIASSGSISEAVTKFSIVNAGTPTPAESQSVCAALRTPAQQLLSATKTALYCGTSHSLTLELAQYSKRVWNEVIGLIQEVNAQSSRVPEFTGRVWESCKAMESLSQSNFGAIKRTILQCISILQDSIKELIECTEQGDREKPDEVCSDNEWDVALSAPEQLALKEGIDLLQNVVALLKQIVVSLMQLSPLLESNQRSELLIWFPAIDRHFVRCNDIIVDICAALYPPFELEELEELALTFEDKVSGVLEQFLRRPALCDTECRQLKERQEMFHSKFYSFRTTLKQI